MSAPDFDAWEQQYQERRQDVLEPAPIQDDTPDFNVWEQQYQAKHSKPKEQPKPAFDDYSDTRDAEMVGEPPDNSGKQLQDEITGGLKKVGATGAYLVTSALEGMVHPLFAPLEGTPFDTNAAIANAVEYWRKKTPKGFTVHDLGVTVSKKPVRGELANIGPVRLVKIQYPARELAGQVAAGAGMMVPTSKALKAGQLVADAAGLSGAPAKIASGVIGGALLGEGKPKQTLENAAMFGLFEAIPALGSVIKSKVQRARLMRAWRKMSPEQRVPVVQGLDEALRNNPQMTEADAVRMSQQWFKEAKQRRVTPLKEESPKEESRSSQEPTAKPEEDIWGPVEEWVSQPPVQSQAQVVAPEAPPASETTKALPAPVPQFPKQQTTTFTPPESDAGRLIDSWEQAYQTKKKTAPLTVDEIVSANTDKERRQMLMRIFDLTPEEMKAIDEDQLAELNDPVKDALTMDYMADMDYAIRTRNKDDVETLLKKIQNKEFADGVPDGYSASKVSPEQEASSSKVSATSGNEYTERLNRTKEPNEQHYKSTGASDTHFEKQIVELPEMIELVRRFMDKDPKVVKAFRDFGVQGQFTSGHDPEIAIRRDLGSNPELAVRVLAHELGHAEDFDFDTMKRGNILGRIAKLRGYLLHQLAERPGAPGPLTAEEKAALREEAQKIRRQEIDKALGDEVGFSPEEVLNFLRGIDTSKLPKKVKEYIAMAPTPVKKSIVKQAMKGLSPEELRHLRSAPRGVGKTIEEHFRELLKKEVERRKLWELEEIREELRAFSKKWRAWDEGTDPEYDKYRNSSKELYADAVSGLILAPDFLKKTAPKFYQAFENYLETRPRFAENWQAIMDRINAGSEEVSRHRIKQTYKDFAAEAEKAKEQERTRIEQRKAEEEKTVDTLLRGLNSKDHPILKFVRRAEKMDIFSKRKAAVIREMLLKRPYTPSEIDAYAYDFKQWYDKVYSEGLTIDELGNLGKLLHIVYNRKDIFSAGGLTPKTAAKDLATLARDWGPEKYNKARKLLNEYRKLREEFILPLLQKSGLITPKMAQIMKERKFYLRVLSQDWLRADQWPGMKQFYRQVGTISRQQNPVVSTFLDDIASIYAARENMLRRSVYRFMTELGAGRKAVMKYSSVEKRQVIDRRAMRHREKVARVKIDGKPQYYFMLDNIVDALEKDSFKQYQVLRLWQTLGQVFRELYVGSNPQWMLRNMPRDFLETVFKNPDIVGVRGIAKLLKAYWETAPDVFKEAWRNERSALIQDMMRRRTLPTNRIWSGFEETPANEIERTLARYNLYKLTGSQKKLYRRFVRRFFEGQTPEQIADAIETFARSVWDKKERLGRASDLWGKVAARKFFDKYTNLPQHEIDRRVIEQAGTPNYKNRPAWQVILNNLFMFSTVAKEGLKADLRALRGAPLKWLAAVGALTVLPAIMNYLADEGMMGKDIKRIFNRIPKYYKDHYFVIPLFVDDNGKANFLAFPTGYNQQVLKATLAKLMRGEFGGAGGALSETTGLSPYSVHPLIAKLATFALYYLYGVNPPNLHYGTNIIAPANYEVGGKAAAKDLFRDAWNDLTGGWLYRAKGPYESRRKSKIEKFLSTFPGNTLGTFYKISDGGLGERIRDKLEAMRKEAKKRNLSIREYRLQIAKDRDAAIATAQVLRSIGNKRQAKELEKDVARLWGDQWAKAIATAHNNEERAAIIQMMMEDNL